MLQKAVVVPDPTPAYSIDYIHILYALALTGMAKGGYFCGLIHRCKLYSTTEHKYYSCDSQGPQGIVQDTGY